MCQDQRLLQPAAGRTLCRAASVCSSPPPSHLHLIENIIGASKCPTVHTRALLVLGFGYVVEHLNTCYLADTDLVS